MELKHIHSDFGFFNGQLYFVIDERMLVVSVGTPNFNDYGEWNIFSFRLSPLKYNPNDNSVELKTYIDTEPNKLTKKDVLFLDMCYKASTDDGLTDEEFKTFEKDICDWDDWDGSLRGGFFKETNSFCIFDTKENPIPYEDWLKLDSQNPFERIFYPILNNFREEYIKKENK